MAELESLYTAAEMKEAEAGHDVEHLMQRAGGAVADAVARDYPGARVVAVCGRGANGGDGRIAAEKLGGLVVAPGQNLQETDVIVDALFGTGFHGEPREEAARSIAAINSAGVPVVAVDIPSGVDASTGEIGGAAVEAELTVTFHGRKVGLVVGPGRFRTGRVELVDIGLEPAETEHRLATRELLRRVPRKRPQDNKYSAGSVLVVGGAPGTTGAACLAAEAAFRADAGYVTVCAPKESLPVIETRLLEAVKRPLEDVFEAAGRAGARCLCVATVPEALELREEFGGARILVMGPTAAEREVAVAREGGLELAVSGGLTPEHVRIHLKLDTGMGRWGLSELDQPGTDVVGMMRHLSTADDDPAFA